MFLFPTVYWRYVIPKLRLFMHLRGIRRRRNILNIQTSCYDFRTWDNTDENMIRILIQSTRIFRVIWNGESLINYWNLNTRVYVCVLGDIWKKKPQHSGDKFDQNLDKNLIEGKNRERFLRVRFCFVILILHQLGRTSSVAYFIAMLSIATIFCRFYSCRRIQKIFRDILVIQSAHLIFHKALLRERTRSTQRNFIS